MRKPCPSCPWRIATKTSDIPGGGMDHVKYRKMLSPDALTAMGCHLDASGPPLPCAGFVLQVGVNNVGIRLALLRGWFKLADFFTDAPLHTTMEDLMAAHPDPHLQDSP